MTQTEPEVPDTPDVAGNPDWTGATVRAGVGDHNHVQTTGYSVTAQWDTSEALTFKSITAFREGNTDTVIDFGNGNVLTLEGVGVDELTRDNFIFTNGF